MTIEGADALRVWLALNYLGEFYVRIVAELPHTPTQKVQKHLIRSQGVTEQTWDREKAGIIVRRHKR